MLRYLITGGSGLLGLATTKFVTSLENKDGFSVGSRECCLTNERKTFNLIADYDPHCIIHLAAKVGGLNSNMNFNAEYFSENIKINTNVLTAARENKVSKVISLLSTCIYPDTASYPLTEYQIHDGPPHSSNFGYAYAKRMVDVQSRAYRQQYGCNFITAVPNNLYGENDNFDLENSHVIPALIRKIYEAKINNFPSVEVWGNGSPLREFTYSADMTEIIFFLLENYDEPHPINIGNTEEYSIKEVVEILCRTLDYQGNIFWNTDKPTGQHRKPSSNQKLLDLGWDKNNYTSLEEGLKNTCEWFIMNYPNIRGFS